jgi:hypothetical protein
MLAAVTYTLHLHLYTVLYMCHLSVYQASHILKWKVQSFVLLLPRLYKQTQHTSKCCSALLYIQVSTASRVTVKLCELYKFSHHFFISSVIVTECVGIVMSQVYVLNIISLSVSMHITCMCAMCSVMIALWL